MQQLGRRRVSPPLAPLAPQRLVQHQPFAGGGQGGPLFILNDGRKYAFMLVTIRYASFTIRDVSALRAGIVVSVVPCLVVYLALQRFYVSGLVAGALRG